IFGDALDLNFGGNSVTNYTAYAARAFFDNGGQVLYLARIANDVLSAGPASARPTPASLAVPATGTALVNLSARFPGTGGNLDVVFQPRRSQRLLQFTTPGSADTVILRLSNVLANALVGSATPPLPAGTCPLQSLVAVATLAPAAGPTPAQYNFVTGQPVIYVDQSGTSHTITQLTAFATGVEASAVGAGAAQAVTLKPPSDAGAAPLYSIPVGTNMRAIFGLPAT